MQVGPGRLFVGSTQRFLQDSLPGLLRCNHSIQYDVAQGPQPRLVQHLHASGISSAFDPKAKALRFQLTTALQAGEAPILVSSPDCSCLKPARGPRCTWLKAKVTPLLGANPTSPLPGCGTSGGSSLAFSEPQCPHQ